MIFDLKQTKHLNQKDLLSILKIKDEEWKFGIFSQKKFFKKNIKKTDIHILLYKSPQKKELVGYTCFRLREFFLLKKKINYMLLDSIIIKKKFKKKKYGRELMKFNNKLIKKQKLPSFLFCNHKNEKFFQLFKWKSEQSQNYKIINNNKKKKVFMSYNNKFAMNKKNLFFINI